jgi:hypothetical protein
MTNEDTDDNDASKNERMAKIRNIVCFQHEFFQANQPNLLHRIKRATKEVAPIEWPSQQKEMESNQNQRQDTKEQLDSFRYEMKDHLDSLRDEFDSKLAKMRAELEIDYLHRINSIEVCYKDLVLMILRSRESSEFPLPSRNQTRVVPGPIQTGVFLPVPRNSSNSSSNSSSNNKSNIQLGPNYSSRDYLVDHKLDLLSPFHQNNGGRRGLSGNTVATPYKTNNSKPVGAALPHWPLPKKKEMLFGNTGRSFNKNNDDTSVRASRTTTTHR